MTAESKEQSEIGDPPEPRLAGPPSPPLPLLVAPSDPGSRG